MEGLLILFEKTDNLLISGSEQFQQYFNIP